MQLTIVIKQESIVSDMWKWLDVHMYTLHPLSSQRVCSNQTLFPLPPRAIDTQYRPSTLHEWTALLQ